MATPSTSAAFSTQTPQSTVTLPAVSNAPQLILQSAYAEAEISQLIAQFSGRTVSQEQWVKPSTVKDYVPNSNRETYYAAALRKHDRRHGVQYYTLPSCEYSFPKYLSANNAQTRGNLIPLPVEPSLESRLFGWERDNTHLSPAPYVRPSLCHWTLPIADAPVTINPRALALRRPIATSEPPVTAHSPAPSNVSTPRPKNPAPSRVRTLAPAASAQSPVIPSVPAPRPMVALPSRVQALRAPGSTQSPAFPSVSTSRPTVPLPSRRQAPRADLLADAQSPSDYCGVPGSGNKRKALNPPAPCSPKKIQPSQPLQTRHWASGFQCGMYRCREIFDSKLSLQRHQQLHAHAHHRFVCAGCPAAYAQQDELDHHLAHSAGCTTEKAAGLLRMFYRLGGVIAHNPASMAQKDLMMLWKGFLNQGLRGATQPTPGLNF